jgi:hypothetical protein
MKSLKYPISATIISAFIFSVAGPLPVHSQEFYLPKPGLMVQLSAQFTPAHLVGLTLDPDNALKFDFLVHRGDDFLSSDQKKQEYQRLVKYFLASLTIPDQDQWVNLSPYEKDRIIKENFGKTEMGRDLLAQDYILKQITSSLIYPEGGLGKKFWEKVYERAWKEYGTSDVPVNTFNKVWIIPDQALVYENGNTAYVLRNHLKVMLEEDYLSLEKHSGLSMAPVQGNVSRGSHTLAAAIVKEIILPELEKEINTGRNFANLRQIYSGMILAAWFKHALKESLLGKIYADKAKVKGVDADPKADERIYRQYLQAYRKGVFNYIKEDVDKYTNEVVPRKYFSGGTEAFRNGAKYYDGAMTSGTVEILSSKNVIPAKLAHFISPDILDSARIDRTAVELNPSGADAAMSGILKKAVYSALLGLPLIAAPAIHAQSREFTEIYRNNQGFYDRKVTQVQAHQELKNNLDKMLNALRSKYGKVVPKTINAPFLEKTAGNAKTYAEFTGAVNHSLRPLLVRYRAGAMTPAEIKDFADKQNEVLRWTYLFWHTNVEYDVLGWEKKLPDTGNMYYAITGNPRVEGNPRTSVCNVSSVLLMVSLFDQGFFDKDTEKNVSVVKVNVNFTGKDQDGEAGGHVADLVKTADGKARIIDLVQGDNPGYEVSDWKYIDDGLPHRVITVYDSHGNPGKLEVTAANLQDANGEILDTLSRNEKGVAEIESYGTRLLEAQGLYSRKEYQLAAAAYAGIIRDIDPRIKFLQVSTGQFKDLSAIFTDEKQQPVGGSWFTGRLEEDRNDAVMGLGNANLGKVIVDIDKAKAIFEQKNYRGAAEASARITADIDKKMKLLAALGITRINKDGSTWKDADGKPADGSGIMDAFMTERNLSQQILANATIGQGNAALDGIIAQINKANALYDQKNYRKASLVFAGILKDAETKIQALTFAGLEDIPASVSTWKDEQGQSVSGAWFASQLREKRNEVSQSYQNAARASKTDQAMLSAAKVPADKYGGIDLNAAHLNMQINRGPQGAVLPFKQDLEFLRNIQGFSPKIIDIQPAAALPILGELQQKLQVAPSVKAAL